MIVNETERLNLRVFRDEDFEDAKEFWGNDEVMMHCNGATPHDLLIRALGGYRKCHEDKGLSVYAVEDKETGKVLGAAGFNIPEGIEKVELIYHFGKQAWGKGYAKEAAQACLQVAENHGQVRTIYAAADPNNIGSLKILEKIGFTFKEMKWFDDTNQEEPYYEYEIS
ncbi:MULTISPECIES: GNAT family N-acetyltransferase [unclassified Bacillus (in: firmicutes)]|uniref:GNAT family N-acetyltransferase n=1 Tax=unclassified Bacillus (in: firmicutes) TaxID=185979 RepID=UPI0008F383AF|nr:MULTISPECIES: GNAT family N-acetyltransferase [unclassified Bacillus (in: firmicutes)]SFA71154.1 Acetyltransferase (GNAT) domain-containing protein [Bacillus sp. UNCCL13]SFQ61276.1 Acetyltransferase (GNAT) domain-containing protein [Bacillus sp. cl95]